MEPISPIKRGALDLRGEYVHTGRQTAFGPDTRSGWYAEAGYKLTRLKSTWLRAGLSDQFSGSSA